MGRKRKGGKKEYTEEETACWLAGKKAIDTSAPASKQTGAPPDGAPAESWEDWCLQQLDGKPKKRRRKPKPKQAPAETAVVEEGQGRAVSLGIEFLDEASAERCPQAVEHWDDPGLPDSLGKCMQLVQSKAGDHVSRPTAVQAQCWPAAVAGHDVLALSMTGSGKTLAYLLPMLPLLEKRVSRTEGDAPLGLVIAPTRELVIQVARECRWITKACGARAVAVYGGQNKLAQLPALQAGVEVVVATPGRLTEMIGEQELQLGQVRYLVLDEADRMLAAGFETQLSAIAATLPADKQTLLLSATFPASVEQAAAKWLKPECVRFRVGSHAVAISRSCTQLVHVCAEHKKARKLLKFLKELRGADHAKRSKSRVMIFCNKIKAALFVHRLLAKEFPKKCAALHGNMSQEARDSAMSAFQCGQAQFIACTDVAARGIHTKLLPYIVNWDFPGSVEQYAHRVGRTARMLGTTGTALTFFTRNFKKLAPSLVKVLEEGSQKVDPNLRALAEEAEMLERLDGSNGEDEDLEVEEEEDEDVATDESDED